MPESLRDCQIDRSECYVLISQALVLKRGTPILGNKRVVAWCFTDNVETELPSTLPDGVKYLVCQQEQGTHLHLQGYLQLSRNQGFAYVKRLRPSAHWEVARGTPAENRTYCTKEDTRVEDTCPVELGTMTMQGKRTDLIQFLQAVKKGKRKRELIGNYTTTFARYRFFYFDIKQLEEPPRDFIGVILLIGPTGTGKTHYVRDKYGGHDLWCVPIGKDTWFDGYDGQKYALMDDFSGQMSLRDTLRLLHRYTEKVPIKGSFAWWNPEIVFVTTNIHPAQWYKWEGREAQKSALMKRFTSIREYLPIGPDDEPPGRVITYNNSEYFTY